jgi:hypothetical protein
MNVWAASRLGGRDYDDIKMLAICATKPEAQRRIGWIARSGPLQRLDDDDPGAIAARACPGNVLALMRRDQPEIDPALAELRFRAELCDYSEGKIDAAALRSATTEILDALVGDGYAWRHADEDLRGA